MLLTEQSLTLVDGNPLPPGILQLYSHSMPTNYNAISGVLDITLFISVTEAVNGYERPACLCLLLLLGGLLLLAMSIWGH